MTDWQSIRAGRYVDSSVDVVAWANPGTKAAFEVLHSFIKDRLKGFDAQRNNPANPSLSGLSPWFHFGRFLCEYGFILSMNGKDDCDEFTEQCDRKR